MFHFITAVLLALPVSSRAQDPVAVSSSSLSLAQALDSARRGNPEIRAALRRWDAARKKILSESTPDKPRLDIERMYAPSGKTPLNGADEKALSVTQELPFPSTLYLRGSRAAKAAGVAEQAYLAKVREIRARTRSSYAALYLSIKSRGLLEENIDLMRRFARVAESKVAAGMSAESDALKAQVELTRMLNMGLSLDEEREVASVELNALMGRAAGEPLGEPRETQSAARPRPARPAFRAHPHLRLPSR